MLMWNDAVHEISGVVPSTTIDVVLRTMGVEPGEGVNPALAKGGFEAVRKVVKRVGREGWSAGQVLEQASRPMVRSRIYELTQDPAV